MLPELFKLNRFLRIENKKLLESRHCDLNLIRLIDNYLDSYALENNLSIPTIIKKYLDFISIYNRHIDFFIRTKKYPIELDYHIEIERTEYDIALILSGVTSLHRHILFKQLADSCSSIHDKILIIGVGSGIELEIIKNYSQSSEILIDAFDIKISPWLKKKFPFVRFYQEEFDYTHDKKYNYIFSIEILEHLETPFKLLQDCKRALEKDGKLFITTAKNIPQFDHLYNFTHDSSFENELNEIDLIIEKKVEIPHHFQSQNIEAKNTYYILKSNLL
jgi:SAM-dependent methyltransferase